MKGKLFSKTVIRFFVYLFLFIFVVPLFFTYNLARPRAIRSDEHPLDYGWIYEDILIEKNNTPRLTGWFLPSLREDPSLTIILLHGYPADKGDILHRAGYLLGDFNVVLFDFRYFGSSGGYYSTLGVKEKDDLSAVLDFLEEEKEITAVGLWGYSMGGAVAILATPEEEMIKGIVVDSAYANPKDMLKRIYYLPIVNEIFSEITLFSAGLITRTNLKTTTPESRMKDIRVPVFLIHPRHDPVIPFNQAEKLVKAVSDKIDIKIRFLDEEIHGIYDKDIFEDIREFFLNIEKDLF